MNTSSDVAALLVGDSRAMRSLREEVSAIAPTQLSVVIEGETGTGKENVARALHLLSGRRGAFVAVNVCAIGDALFESEMFGHERGAFTGAVTSRSGRFVEADNGTLLLDELSGMNLGAQAKLLRALETGTVRPVGAVRDRSVATRFLGATNVPLADLVAREQMRADLGFRLAQWRIRVPSLSERPEDIPALVRCFAQETGSVAGSVPDSTLAVLASLPWPGNVRQLKSFTHVWRTLHPRADSASAVRELWERVSGHVVPAAAELQPERAALLELLGRFGGRKREAARAMGIHISTLYRRLYKAGLGDTPRQSVGRGAGLAPSGRR